jgi:vesicle coat complex subunit
MMPNKSALVLNALLASLEDDNSLIKRGALDFLSSYARIEDDVFKESEY